MRDTTLGVLAYVLIFVAGWVAPLIIYLVAKKEDKINRFHAMQALLLSILQLLVWVPMFAFFFFPFVGFPFFARGDMDAFPAGFGAAFGMFIAFAFATCGLTLLFLVLVIVGAVKASRGEFWKMPVLGPLADKWS